ncbi:hypothetical protein ABIG06_006335 [Bradyrhizobium sp. USDA 326]
MEAAGSSRDCRRYRTASLRHRDEASAAYAHSAQNHGVSYGFAFTYLDGVDGTSKYPTGYLRATMNRQNVRSDPLIDRRIFQSEFYPFAVGLSVGR